jgi:hypothetical protein
MSAANCFSAADFSNRRFSTGLAVFEGLGGSASEGPETLLSTEPVPSAPEVFLGAVILSSSVLLH